MEEILSKNGIGKEFVEAQFDKIRVILEQNQSHQMVRHS